MCKNHARGTVCIQIIMQITLIIIRLLSYFAFFSCSRTLPAKQSIMRKLFSLCRVSFTHSVKILPTSKFEEVKKPSSILHPKDKRRDSETSACFRKEKSAEWQDRDKDEIASSPSVPLAFARSTQWRRFYHREAKRLFLLWGRGGLSFQRRDCLGRKTHSHLLTQGKECAMTILN